MVSSHARLATTVVVGLLVGGCAAAASPAQARYGYTATLLPDGRVLVVGDYDYESRASAALYDPGSGS